MRRGFLEFEIVSSTYSIFHRGQAQLMRVQTKLGRLANTSAKG